MVSLLFLVLFIEHCLCDIEIRCYDESGCLGNINRTLVYEDGKCVKSDGKIDKSREILCTFDGHYIWKSYCEENCAENHVTIYSGGSKCLTKDDIKHGYSSVLPTDNCYISGCPNNAILTVSVIIPVSVLLCCCVICVFPCIFICMCCPPFIVSLKRIFEIDERIKKEPLSSQEVSRETESN